VGHDAWGHDAPREALRVATDLGSIETGKLADLVVLTGNPLEQIENSDSVLYIMVNGHLYDAETMDGLWPGTEPRGPFPHEAVWPPGMSASNPLAAEVWDTPFGFNHVFAGGYSAGYYSYLWCEVLDADAFEAFKEKGLFDQQMATNFRRLLSRGGSRPGMEMYREFRGRDPEIDPLLVRRGLITE
jgi:hypothetical protein